MSQIKYESDTKTNIIGNCKTTFDRWLEDLLSITNMQSLQKPHRDLCGVSFVKNFHFAALEKNLSMASICKDLT